MKHEVKTQKLTVVTFNTQGSLMLSTEAKKRFGKIGKTLNLLDTDIINLQEVFTYPQLDILKKKLKKFDYCSYKRFIFGPKGGLVTFSKFPIQVKGYISFPPMALLRYKFLRIFIKDLFLYKGVLVNKFKNSGVVIANTHLTANHDNDWSKKNRFFPIHQNQLETLYKLANFAEHRDYIIISGDFNVSKKSSLYKELIKRLKVKDVFEKYSSPTFRQEFMSKDNFSNRIDYLFVGAGKKKRIKLTNRQHIFVGRSNAIKDNRGFLSDHLGLKATIELG